MALTRLSPKEFLQDCFPPRLACLWSEDVHEISLKNGINFLQLIQPFLRPSAELISSDLTNRRFYLKNFCLSVTTVEEAQPPIPSLARNILDATVAASVRRAINRYPIKDQEDQGGQVHIPRPGKGFISIPGSTPWFEAFRDQYLRLLPTSDYECIRDFLGCIFVVSTSVVDPVNRAKSLIEEQVQQQANQKGRWFGPNILKFFIVLHDLSNETDATRTRGDSAIQYFTTTYGENNSCLLKINSQSKKQSPDPWISSLSSSDGNYKADDLSAELTVDGTDTVGDGLPDHPLAVSYRPAGTIKSREPGKTPSSNAEIGLLLGEEDAERIKECVTGIIAKCLIPYAERQIRILNELIISKKGIHRTLVNATKKIFGPSGPPRPAQKASSASNLSQVVYAGEAVELHNRKAGDLSFMLQLYDQAFQFFQSARRDYSTDQAWNYYAAASEMCGLAAFLSPTGGFSSANSRGFPIQYFEAAIKSYSDVNKTSPQGVRATIFATEICKALHLYLEAATFFKTRTPDDFDLLYGLFLEQAGHCFLRLEQSGSCRKFAFQMILAGFRYFKATQRELGVLVYQYALKIFEGQGWIVAEDHIRLNIIRYSMTLKLFQECLPHFSSLLTGAQRQIPAQQILMLKDFLTCHEIVDGPVAVTDLALPSIDMEAISTILGRPGDTDASSVQVLDDQWLVLEEKTLAVKGHSTHIFKHQQFFFTNLTDNKYRPVASVGEAITVEIPVKNPLGVTLLLSSLVLEYEFHPRAGSASQDAISGTNSSGGGTGVSVTVDAQEIRLGPSGTARLTFVLMVGHPGALSINGLSYTATLLSTEKEETPSQNLERPLRINGTQKFSIRGARLNHTKVEKMGLAYGPDHRLDITVLPPRGRLTAKWENFPRGVLSGQVVRLNLMIENDGKRAVDHLAVAASLPDLLIFFNAAKQDNIVTVVIPSGRIEAGKKVSLTAVLVAPSLPGSYCLRTLLYYESTADATHKPLHRHHIARMQHDFEVLPGLTMKGFLVPSVASSRDEAVVSLQISHVNQIQLEAIPLKLIEILSVNCRWRINSLADFSLGDGTLFSNEETFLTLVARKTPGQESDFSGFSVPAVLDAGDLNFVKAARSLATAYDTQTADTLCLRLLWKVTLTSDGKPTSVYGLRFINFNLDDQGGKSKYVSGQVMGDIADILARPLTDPQTAAFLHMAPVKSEISNFDVVDWKVELPLAEAVLGGEHLVIVPVTVDLTCTTCATAEEALVNVTVELRTAVKCFPVGCRKQSVVMKPGDGITLTFDYCFTASGTYNMAEFVYVKALSCLILELKVAKLQKPTANQMLLRVT